MVISKFFVIKQFNQIKLIRTLTILETLVEGSFHDVIFFYIIINGMVRHDYDRDFKAEVEVGIYNVA